eukprot:gene13866-4813_t
MAAQDLVLLLQQQIEQQRIMMERQDQRHQEQLQAILAMARKSEEKEPIKTFTGGIQSFSAFDSATELCGRVGHNPKDCRFKNTTCHYCNKIGHIEAACLKKKKESAKLTGERNKLKKIFSISQTNTVNKVKVPELQLPIKLEGQHMVNFEVDTGAGDNFLGKTAWKELGEPILEAPSQQFESASQHKLPVLGTVMLQAETENYNQQSLGFNVTELPDLNLLGRSAIAQLGISVDTLIEQNSGAHAQCHAVFEDLKPDRKLQAECRKLCEEFPDLFKPELGRLKDFELEVKFKPDAKLNFCKARAVPFALQEDLAQAYEAGIRRGVWQRITTQQMSCMISFKNGPKTECNIRFLKELVCNMVVPLKM